MFHFRPPRTCSLLFILKIHFGGLTFVLGGTTLWGEPPFQGLLYLAPLSAAHHAWHDTLGGAARLVTDTQEVRKETRKKEKDTVVIGPDGFATGDGHRSGVSALRVEALEIILIY